MSWQTDIWRKRPAGMVVGFDFSGGRVSSPTGHTGVLTNGAAIAAGTRYLALDGVNDYMRVADAPELDMSGDMTLAAWAKRNGIPAGSNIITGKFDSSTNTGWMVYVVPTTGQAGFDGGVGAGYRVGPRSTASICDNTWHHIAATRAGATWSLYVDGALNASSSVASGTFANAKDLGIGAYDAYGGWRDYLSGGLAGIRIYNRALTQPEIAQIYNAGAARVALGGTP